MKKILVSAYAVSPYRGSECAVGWEITKRLGKYFDVTVLMCYETPSKKKYYEEVMQYIDKQGVIENVNYIPIQMPRMSNFYTFLHDIGFWPAFYWAYNLWQKSAYRKASELHRDNDYDAVYQLNMVGYREPGYLWKLDVPFFWGPINGFHSVPFSFLKSLNGFEYLSQISKHLVNDLQANITIRPRLAARKAQVAWCIDYIAVDKIKQWGGNACPMVETGLNLPPELSDDKRRSFQKGERLNIVWSGIIISGKALDILLDALINIQDLNFHLTIIGDGSLRSEMQVKAKPISSKITWTGWIDRSSVLDIMNEANLLVFTSLKEATSVTIMEALGLGIPVVCHDTCGMGIVVNDNNGFKIPYVDRQTSSRYIANLLTNIISDPEILNRKYRTVRDDVSHLTWDSKVKRISDTMIQQLDELSKR